MPAPYLEITLTPSPNDDIVQAILKGPSRQTFLFRGCGKPSRDSNVEWLSSGFSGAPSSFNPDLRGSRHPHLALPRRIGSRRSYGILWIKSHSCTHDQVVRVREGGVGATNRWQRHSILAGEAPSAHVTRKPRADCTSSLTAPCTEMSQCRVTLRSTPILPCWGTHRRRYCLSR